MLPPGLTFTELDRLAQMSRYNYGPQAQVVDIGSGDIMVSVTTATEEDAESAVEVAREAQVLWQEMGEYRRSIVLSNLASVLTDNIDKAIGISQVLAGKSRLDALDEILDIIISARACSRLSRRVMGARRRGGLLPFFTNYRTSQIPKGVVGVFTLCDFPLGVLSDVLPPITAGNAVVHFVPAQAAIGAYYARQLFEAAGLPANLWQIVPATNRNIGIDVVPLLDHVTVFGSSQSALPVVRKAQKDFIQVTSYLSVKNTAIVMEDADLEEAAKAVARVAFQCAGQSRTAVEKVYIHEKVYERFMEIMKRYTRAQIQIGTFSSQKATMGSLYSQKRLDLTRKHVDDAVFKGANVITGGHWRPDVGPYFFEPTILENVPEDAAVSTEETYGPVLVVDSFKDLGEVLAEINQSKFSFMLCVFSSSMSLVRQVVSNVNIGGISINDGYQTLYTSWLAPLSFSKQSGFGSAHGLESIYQYTRAISVSRLKVLSLTPDVLSDASNEKCSIRLIKVRQAMLSIFVYSPFASAIRAGYRKIRNAITTTL